MSVMAGKLLKEEEEDLLAPDECAWSPKFEGSATGDKGLMNPHSGLDDDETDTAPRSPKRAYSAHQIKGFAQPFASPIRGGRKSERITLDLLQKFYDMPLMDVAKQLGISITMLKKICRKFGIQRWPHRQIQSITKNIDRLRHQATTTNNREDIPEIRTKIDVLEKKLRLVTRGASCGLHSTFRNAIFLANPEDIEEDQLFDKDVLPKLRHALAPFERMKRNPLTEVMSALRNHHPNGGGKAGPGGGSGDDDDCDDDEDDSGDASADATSQALSTALASANISSFGGTLYLSGADLGGLGGATGGARGNGGDGDDNGGGEGGGHRCRKKLARTPFSFHGIGGSAPSLLTNMADEPEGHSGGGKRCSRGIGGGGWGSVISGGSKAGGGCSDHMHSDSGSEEEFEDRSGPSSLPLGHHSVLGLGPFPGSIDGGGGGGGVGGGGGGLVMDLEGGGSSFNFDQDPDSGFLHTVPNAVYHQDMPGATATDTDVAEASCMQEAVAAAAAERAASVPVSSLWLGLGSNHAGLGRVLSLGTSSSSAAAAAAAATGMSSLRFGSNTALGRAARDSSREYAAGGPSMMQLGGGKVGSFYERSSAEVMMDLGVGMGGLWPSSGGGGGGDDEGGEFEACTHTHKRTFSMA